MSAMRAAGPDSLAPEGEPRSHRREGKAKIALPPRSFREEFWANPRTAMSVALGGGAAIVWGTNALVAEDAGWLRAGGLLALLGGALLWGSYLLRYQPGLVSGERWSRSRVRRAVRFVLVHAWVAMLSGACLFVLIARLTD